MYVSAWMYTEKMRIHTLLDAYTFKLMHTHTHTFLSKLQVDLRMQFSESTQKGSHTSIYACTHALAWHGWNAQLGMVG
jgi:hypothetical protein